jgi:hypothetical protein
MPITEKDYKKFIWVFKVWISRKLTRGEKTGIFFQIYCHEDHRGISNGKHGKLGVKSSLRVANMWKSPIVLGLTIMKKF